ncbi:sensor histidine kinase [Paenibacillus sp. 79R4]|uniref:sensor histidine kinase n=1 Tax=Paenibacillus sp. 79R4 TaxID=2212847 RepID=UPI0015BA060B|nr:histidine kinase [Paenibacillus sp. 79R4]NWL86324.1 sensor histidine kinase [Paenibacillus sp. 79R4]
MRKLLHFRDFSIFKKIMAAFLAALLPLMLITWIINQQGAASIRKEISESMMNTTHFYLDSLDQEVDRIYRYLPNYVMDTDLMELASTGDVMSAYERSAKVLEIQKRLHLMKDSSPFIQESRAYVPLIERTILSSNYETKVEEQEYQAMRQSTNMYDQPFIYWQNRLFISMQYPGSTVRDPLFAISIELSTRKIIEKLSQITNSREGQTAMLRMDQEWSLVSGSNTGLLDVMKQLAVDKQEQQAKEGYETIKFEGKRYLTIYRYSELWNSYLVSSVPESAILGPIRKYQVWFWCAAVLAVGIVLFFSYSLRRLIYRPLMRLIYSFRRVQQNKLEYIAVDRGEDEFGYLYHAFNNTVSSLKTLIEENYEQQIRNQRSELKRLQSQINPHFLYNCFFVLCRLIKSDHQKEKAYQFCLYIGQYFQFITRNTEDEIPLSMEMDHSRTYVEMQRICYGDRIGVEFDDRVPDMMVPRLILQPIIENAYVHALGNMRSHGMLRVYGETREETFILCIEDNGDSISELNIQQLNDRLARPHYTFEETTGLINVHRRLQLRYGEEYGITVSRSDLGGLKVTIQLRMS